MSGWFCGVMRPTGKWPSRIAYYIGVGGTVRFSELVIVSLLQQAGQGRRAGKQAAKAKSKKGCLD